MYLNQRWLYNKEGDTIGGNYYELKYISIKDKNEVLRLHFALKQPLISSDSELFICIPRSEKLNTFFSNEKELRWDTIPNLKNRFENQGKYLNRNLDVVFDIESQDLLNNTLRGFLLEKYLKENDSIDFATRKIYFNLNIGNGSN